MSFFDFSVVSQSSSSLNWPITVTCSSWKSESTGARCFWFLSAGEAPFSEILNNEHNKYKNLGLGGAVRAFKQSFCLKGRHKTCKIQMFFSTFGEKALLHGKLANIKMQDLQTRAYFSCFFPPLENHYWMNKSFINLINQSNFSIYI